MSNFLSTNPDYQKAATAGKMDMEEEAYSRIIAYEYLMGCSSNKAKELRKELANDHAKGNNKYPKDLETAVEMVTNYRGSGGPNLQKRQEHRSASNKNNNNHNPNIMKESIGFVQVVAGKDGQTHPKIDCYHCNKKGHYANQCPQAITTNAQVQRNTGQTLVQANDTTVRTNNQSTNTAAGNESPHTSIIGWTCVQTCLMTHHATSHATLKEKLRT